MRISRIEFENFRNFRQHGEIDFATDGKVTIIYGKNGDGKTTLHQLMQWIIYGRVKFNKTATESLYNLGYEKDLPGDTDFDVWGKMEFTHDGNKYLLHRVAHYHKPYIDKTTYIGDELHLWKVTAGEKQEEIKNPVVAMEMLLPVGLSDYFFFDGESMIADLKVKGTEAAKSLRKALFSIFDLDILDMACMHIGDIEQKQTVLGQLFLSRGDEASGSAISLARQEVENAQDYIETYKNKLKEAREEKKACQETVRAISEQIGTSKSKAEYESIRNSLLLSRDNNLKLLENFQEQFGTEVSENYTHFLISKVIADARKKLKMKVDQTNLPDGITTRLIDYLLGENVLQCICGNPICEENRRALEKWRELLPPKSYALLYHDFAHAADNWSRRYNREVLPDLVARADKLIHEIETIEEQIREMDNAQKKSGDISDLVTARENAEAKLVLLDADIVNFETELRKAEIYLRKKTKAFDELTKATKATQDANRRIAIMEQVQKYFSDKLERASSEYSEKLQKYIQKLLNQMLTAHRRVEVDTSFSVKIMDSHEDESKSEGQFAVVSFAYIGGILKLLQSEEGLAQKEYPLVLDGPFSKLDEIQRQNVVDTIPRFAPQVILFSKDPLEEVFSQTDIGRRYTLESNYEKNDAVVKEGYLWN